MHQHIEAKRARYFFESVAEMQAWIDRTPPKWRYSESKAPSSGYSWDLSTDYEGACKLARDGWIEGAQRVQDALKVFTLATPAPDTRTDVYGFRPHVPRYCAGAPDSMVRYAREAQNGRGKVLTLIVPINANCFTDARCMANFGTAIAQYVNQMETEGARVELIAAMTNELRNHGWRLSFAVRVKYAEQPLDLAVLAFAIGHPAFFRRLCFALKERSHAPAQSNYGHSVNTRVDDVLNAPVGAVVLNGMKDANTYAPTAEAGFKYVQERIEKTLEAMDKGE